MTSTKKEKPKHLGRGLQSLLGPIRNTEKSETQEVTMTNIEANFPSDKELQNSLREIKVGSITANPYQPRKVWDENELSELAESIRVNGIIQPIIVRPVGSKFELIAGERRLKAAESIGLQTIPAMVRKATDEQMLELALIENIHRTDLNPVERAQAYRNYLKTFSLTQAEAADRLGESRSVVANYMRLLDLPEYIQKMLAGGSISMGHAKALLSLPTDEERRKLVNRALAGRLSVRDLERMVRKQAGELKELTKRLSYKPPHIVDLEKKLTQHLGTKVIVDAKRGGHRGKIVIEFYSLDDFQRITEQIGVESLEEV